LRVLLQRVAGVHQARPLPRLARQSFADWFEERAASTKSVTRGEAVYFADTFTNYYHPEVGRAAVRLLEALGYGVVLVRGMTCCGRPAISKGLLPLAKRWARRNVETLLPYARRGLPIVGTEPSCIAAFRDEYPDLLRDEDARVVAGQTLLLDELLSRLAQSDPSIRDLFQAPEGSGALLHAHCHQKAMSGAEPTLAALRVAGIQAELIDSGCCGMAGAFGFEAEHYEVSRAMGALRLFPAVEAAGPEREIAITGVSCRQQIEHFTSRRPWHSAELLSEALRDM
jgi:Fe-S oxidoreductase